MTVATEASTLTRFCSLCARQASLDPAGHAHAYEHVLAVEIPLPWPETMYDTPGVLPQELLDFRALVIESYQRGEPIRSTCVAIAPDRAYSQPGFRRVISYRRPQGHFAEFTQQEYLVPEELYGPLCWAQLVAPEDLPRFDEYLLLSATTRDLMVCTHGSVDAACAKFGFPIYRYLRQLADQSQGQLRVWRVSHFGGHVFAPTLLDLPEFRYWAYIEREQADLLFDRQCDAVQLYDHYRGWAGFDSAFLQTAERELFVKFGWSWISYLKTGEVLAEGPEDDNGLPWADVRIDYISPDGTERGAYEAHVTLSHHVETIHSSKSEDTYPYPQYAVTRLEQCA